MPKPSLLALVPLTLAFPAAALAAPPQGQGEVEALVLREAADAADLSPGALWTRALALREAEALEGEAGLDRALETMLEREDLSPRAVLLLAAARLQGVDPDPAVLVGPLSGVLDSADEDVAMAAAGLLGNDLFRRLDREARQELGERLVAGARAVERSPEYRMRFAESASRVGRGTEMRQARDEMRAFLESSDPRLRALGALALAGTGAEISGELRDELERLARLPDERGRLAASLLKVENVRELHESKYRELQRRIDSDDLPDSLRKFQAVMRMVDRYHLEGDRVGEQDLVESALDGMLRSMDEHSSYLSPESYAKFLLDLEAEYGGIGAYVGLDPDNGLFTINRPIYSGPAYRAGLMTDDKIVRIDDWPTVGEDVDAVIDRLKGEPNTAVKVYVWRRGMDPDLIERPTEDMAVVLQRERIQIPAVASQMLPGGVGLVELSTFSRNVHEELREVIDELSGQGMRALVLDLRRNSGGLLTEARNVADLFLPRGKLVVKTQNSFDDEPELLHTYTSPLVPEDLPLVVLTSRFTASASEIVAGALKDHGRATVVGERSFGKGSVQQLMPVLGVPQDEWEDRNENGRWDTWEPILADHDGDGEVDYAPRVKLTIARYLLPSGRSIHRELDEDGNLLSEGGIEPDLEVRQPLVDGWRVQERRRVYNTKEIQQYVDRHWSAHFETFRELAVTDLKDPERYPDFDRLMAELATTLPRDDVRMLVRAEVRRRIQDDRGMEFPLGDFQEDFQLQRAIDVALGGLDDRPTSYEPYAATFIPEDQVRDDRLLAAEVGQRDRLRDAAALIREIRDAGGAPSREQLDRVLEILSTTDAGESGD